MSDKTTDLSAQLFVELQRLNGAINLYRSFATMVGFIPKAHYNASHVDQKECYTAEQWLSDFFANKTGLIPSFLDMNQCVPQSPDAAAKMISAFLGGIETLPTLTPRDGGQPLGLFEALKLDVTSAEKSRKLMGTSPIYITEKQKELAIDLIDECESQCRHVTQTMRELLQAYKG